MDREQATPGAYTPICVIGASAGGVGALRSLFQALPDNLGLAYIVILHLAPDQPSVMNEILESATKMPVRQVQDTPQIKPNCVYVIAPDTELVIEGDNVHSRPFTKPRGQRAPIDMLFRSLAEGRGDGLAIILTGAGSDGALGVAAVKEAGGVIFIQDPAEAEFPSMPNSAIATGMADFVAPIVVLAERIAEVAQSKEAVRSLDEDSSANDLRRIVNFLHSRTGHDFSSYKRATVMRRVLRRMQVCRIISLPSYFTFLQDNPEEASELFRDMLISVTQFFRDPAAFETLSQLAIIPLFNDLQEEGIRCWVPGCATGEEAYTVAMLIAEEASRRNVTVQVQIFATDLDDGALATARDGLYPRMIEADVSEERLARFFVEEGTHYRVRQDIREMVLFASHSVLKDPPFLRLDLISCRNLLIYLERSLQEKLCSVFYYGLRSNRFLFLGSAETADAAPKLFTAIQRDAKLYLSRADATRHLPMLNHRFGAGTSSTPPRPARVGERDEDAAARHAEALEEFAPPSILVDDAHHVLHLSPSAGKYIYHSGGTFSGRLSSNIRPELRLDLSHAIDQALEQKQPTLTLATKVVLDGETRRVAMSVSPVQPDDGALAQALVLFLDAGTVEAELEGEAEREHSQIESYRLHAELKGAKEALGRSRTEHDFAIQELRAANEELQSINEEYRSTAEELETSKEELQSMNEELQTVNMELKIRLDSISSAHSDLRNLTAATEIGTLFLDDKLRIRMFTQPIAALFNITDGDVGRALTDFTHRLKWGRIEQDIREVLRDLAPLEAEVESTDGRRLMMRVRPYRTVEDRIEGAVLSFVDISSLRSAEQREVESEARYRLLFDTIDQGFCVIQMLFDDSGKPVDYRFVEVNQAFTDQSGITDPVGRRMREIEPEHEDLWFEVYGKVALTRETQHFEATADRLGRSFEVNAFPFGEPELFQVGVLFQDVTARKRAESQREMLTQELSHRVKNTLAVVQGLASQTSRHTSSVEEFRESFIGRLHALANAHGLLLASQWQSADMYKLVETALGAYDGAEGEAILITGPTVALKPKQSLGLSLILHELATNAAKYGALSKPEGRLEVSWSILPGPDGDEVHLRWEERDGPKVTPPKKRGFGTQLINRAARFELQGRLELNYAPLGCVTEMHFPLR